MAGTHSTPRGKMDIREQHKTLALFWDILVWSVIGVAATLVLMAIFLT
jgi:hypothetical protein